MGWKRKGLFYVKTERCRPSSDMRIITISRLFCITYWFLKKLYPDKY